MQCAALLPWLPSSANLSSPPELHCDMNLTGDYQNIHSRANRPNCQSDSSRQVHSMPQPSLHEETMTATIEGGQHQCVDRYAVHLLPESSAGQS